MHVAPDEHLSAVPFSNPSSGLGRHPSLLSKSVRSSLQPCIASLSSPIECTPSPKSVVETIRSTSLPVSQPKQSSAVPQLPSVEINQIKRISKTLPLRSPGVVDSAISQVSVHQSCSTKHDTQCVSIVDPYTMKHTSLPAIVPFSKHIGLSQPSIDGNYRQSNCNSFAININGDHGCTRVGHSTSFESGSVPLSSSANGVPRISYSTGQIIPTGITVPVASLWHRFCKIARSFRLQSSWRVLRTSRKVLFVAISLLLIFSTFFFLPKISISTRARPNVVKSLNVNSSRSLFLLHRYVRRLLHNYQRLLHIYPLGLRAVSAGIIFFLADFIAQFLNRPRHKSFRSCYSFGRNIRYSIYGFLVLGPMLHMWYKFMHRYGPPDTLRGSLLKALIENFTLEPWCIVNFIIYDGIVNRRPLSYVKRTLRLRFFPLWVNQAVYWIPANFSNYYIGTPDMRVIFANMCSLLWNIYFSAKASRWSSEQPYEQTKSSDSKTEMAVSV